MQAEEGQCKAVTNAFRKGAHQLCGRKIARWAYRAWAEERRNVGESSPPNPSRFANFLEVNPGNVGRALKEGQLSFLRFVLLLAKLKKSYADLDSQPKGKSLQVAGYLEGTTLSRHLNDDWPQDEKITLESFCSVYYLANWLLGIPLGDDDGIIEDNAEVRVEVWDAAVTGVATEGIENVIRRISECAQNLYQSVDEIIQDDPLPGCDEDPPTKWTGRHSTLQELQRLREDWEQAWLQCLLCVCSDFSDEV